MLMKTNLRLCLAVILVLSFLGVGFGHTLNATAAKVSAASLAPTEEGFGAVQVQESDSDRIVFTLLTCNRSMHLWLLLTNRVVA